MAKKWTIDKICPGDKNISIYANGISVIVDYDDCDREEAERIARFIVDMQSQYPEWKKAQKQK